MTHRWRRPERAYRVWLIALSIVRRGLGACARAMRCLHLPKRPERAYRDLWLIALSIILVLLAARALHNSAESNHAAKLALGASVQSKQAADLAIRTSDESKRAADLAARAATAIQQQRIDTIRTSCESQNAEHDRGIKTLNQNIPRGTRGWHITKLLIEQLAPPQDCARVIRQATSVPSALPALDEKFPPFLPKRGP